MTLHDTLLLAVAQGYVETVGPESFLAIVDWDGTLGDSDLEEIVEIRRTTVSPPQQQYLQPGAYFTWRIGYRLPHNTNDKQFSDITFSKETATQEELDEAKRGAEEISRNAGWLS